MNGERRMHTILHLGAGRGSDLADHLSSGAERIVLVEADPDAVKTLRRAAAEHDHVEVVHAAVSGEASGQEVMLRRFNLRRFNSIRTPTGLRELYPGLRQIGDAPAPARTLAQLVEELPIDPASSNHLVIDVPGEDGAVVSALCSDGLDDVFDYVTLHCGTYALFERSKPAEELLRTLAECGYELTGGDDGEDPDRPVWTLYRDRRQVEIRRLRQQLSDRDARIKELQKDLHELRSTLQERDKKIEEAERQYTNANERNSFLQKELRRVEAQLELMKEFTIGSEASS